MATPAQRASREDIYAHLRELLGKDAEIIPIQVSKLYKVGQRVSALRILKEFDASLGGTGIFKMHELKLPGVYRALTYVEMPLEEGYAENNARQMIHAACGYLEELIKKTVRLWLWEKTRVDGLPLGRLIHKIEKRIPDELVTELRWLNKYVYNPAKHHYNMENDPVSEPEHYFSVDEAIAVYLIVRKLGLQLKELSDKTIEELMSA